MHKQFYFLSPLEVVKVTPQNMEEVAEWCGGTVDEIESRRTPGKMDKYVLVPTPKETNQSGAYVGMYVTKRMVITADNKLKVTYAVFRQDYFNKNYFDSPTLAVDMTWERNAREEAEALANSPVGAAFERALHRQPKPEAPKKAKAPAVPIEKLMGPDYKESVDKAMDEKILHGDVESTEKIDKKLAAAQELVERMIPGAKIVLIEDNLEDLAGDVTTPRGGIKFWENKMKPVPVDADPDKPNIHNHFQSQLCNEGCPVFDARLEVSEVDVEIKTENLGGLFDEERLIGMKPEEDDEVFGEHDEEAHDLNPKTLTVTYEEAMADLQKRYDNKEITIEQYRAIRDSQQKPVAEEASTD